MDVVRFADDNLVSAMLAMSHHGQEITHRAARHKQTVLLTEQFSASEKDVYDWMNKNV